MHAYSGWPILSAATTHKIESSDLNPSTCELASLRVSHQAMPQRYLSSGLMDALWAAYADPVVFTNVRKLRVRYYKTGMFAGSQLEALLESGQLNTSTRGSLGRGHPNGVA